MKQVTLYGRVFIRGDIKAVTGLHIGGAAGAFFGNVFEAFLAEDIVEG